MVPEEAILYRIDGPVLFLVEPGSRVSRRVVELGIHLNGAVEIVDGALDEGDLVVTRGHAELSDGSVVALRQRDGSQVPPKVSAKTPDKTGQ